MIEEEKRVISSLHAILEELLDNHVNIYGSAVTQPNGHLITSKFQSEKDGFPAELQEEDEETTEEGKYPEVDRMNQYYEQRNFDETSVEQEKWSKDKSGIFMLAYSYNLILECIESVGKLLNKGEIRSIYFKSKYTNLIINPVTPLANLIMVITSGKAFDFRFFIKSQALYGTKDDIDKDLQEDILEIEENFEEKDEVFFQKFKDELPGLLGMGHVGIKDHMGSYRLFGSFNVKKENLPSGENDENETDFAIAGSLSYVFFIGDKLIQEGRNLELDLIQLNYEHGYVFLKPKRNIAIIFDTAESFEHKFIEENFPNHQEYQQVLQEIKNGSNKLTEIYENVKNWLEKGVNSLKKRKPTQALEYFSKALEIKLEQPYDSKVWFTIANSLKEQSKYKEAIVCYDQFHRENPKDVPSWKKHAKACWYIDQEKRAIKCLKNVIKLDKTDEKVWFHIAVSYIDIKKYRKAIHYYKKVLKLRPDSKDAWDYLSHAYFELKRYRKAISCYKKILVIDKDDSSAWIGIGWALNKLRKYHESIETFDIAISIDPDSSVAWNDRGCGFYRLKNYEEAMECYKKAMDLDPRLKYPWGNIGEVNQIWGNYQIAVDYLGVAIKLDPNYKYYKRKLRKAKRKLKWARKKFLHKISKLSDSNPKLPLSDINKSLQPFIKPLLRKETNLEDLLHYLIRSKQLNAKIAEDCLEFVEIQKVRE